MISVDKPQTPGNQWTRSRAVTCGEVHDGFTYTQTQKSSLFNWLIVILYAICMLTVAMQQFIQLLFLIHRLLN